MKLSSLLATIIAIHFAGCASAKKSAPQASEETRTGIVKIEDVQEKAPAVITETKPEADEGYYIVIGPGLSRVLSVVGVIKELESAEVKVSGYCGTELGAVTSNILSMFNLNKLEWELSKFKKDLLQDKRLLGFSKSSSDGKALEQYLDKLFADKEIQKARLNSCVYYSGSARNSTVVQTSGKTKELVRLAMGLPGLVKPVSRDGDNRYSAGLGDPYPVERIKEVTGARKLLCIDVVGPAVDHSQNDRDEEFITSIMKAQSNSAKQSLEKCDEVIIVDNSGLGYLSFDSMAEYQERGSAAARKWINERHRP